MKTREVSERGLGLGLGLERGCGLEEQVERTARFYGPRAGAEP